MYRFVLRENIRRFRKQIADATSESQRETLQGLLEQAEAELRELEDASSPKLRRANAALGLFAERAVVDAMRLHRAQFGVLQIYDGEQDGLIIIAQKNFRPEFLRPFVLVKMDNRDSIAVRCFNEGRTIVIEDVNADPSFQARRGTAREGGFAAVQSSAIKDRFGTVLGVLSTHFETPQSFSAADVQRMGKFADSIGRELAARMTAPGSGSE